jgi:hypothetical protein
MRMSKTPFELDNVMGFIQVSSGQEGSAEKE